MTSETEITTLNRKRGNIKSQITKLANALVDKTEHSIPKLQAQLDIVSRLQEKFELLKNDYYKITNTTEFADVESSLDSVEDDLLNLELSDNEKLHYLRGSLKGEAKIIETADDDFSSLFKALEQRYENKRVIVDCHIKNILNLQVMKRESSEDLRILLDNVKKNLRSLKILDFERDKLSNALLLNVVLDKLDRETRKQFELTLKDNEVPDFDACLEFLERRYQILCSIHNNNPTKSNSERSKSFFIKSNKPKKCGACNNQTTHSLYQCDKFKAMKLSDRTELVKKLRACLNCLSEFHVISACNSKRSCFVCKKKHHTLLHKYSTPTTDPNVFPSSEPPVASPADMCSVQEVVNNSESNSFLEHSRASFHTNRNCKSVLINSAIIYVKDSKGIRRPLRAILDCASESSFISSNAANVLGLKKQKVNIPICGLKDASININRRISAQISNAKNDSQWDIDFLLVPKISHLSPSKKINVEHWNIPNNVQLADPTFFIPQKVDLLLGAELFFAFLEKDKIKIGNNLFLQSSCFGYLVSGNISDNNLDISTKYCFLTKNLEALNKTLTNFWEIEDVDYQKTCNSEELNYCNEHFAKTHFRKADGKYVVCMPLKPEFPETMLGNSKMIASKRLDQLWTRLERDPTMKALYSDFLNEYESLHHMEEVKEDTDLDAGYYLPHHDQITKRLSYESYSTLALKLVVVIP
ncbi:hypothetical protein AVEN_184476-1 [Araneus ventricosus]|uniref:Uncharacterized protein n=1 Tax=Araneus ventricosus TaxID=182803 RepID=A0A4Y2BFS3_ARAVE|nr:hypothetical protein AVEN_184476-1 [Araneus ventricosus]